VRQVKRAPANRFLAPPSIRTPALLGYQAGQSAARISQAQTRSGAASMAISLRTRTATRSGA